MVKDEQQIADAVAEATKALRDRYGEESCYVSQLYNQDGSAREWHITKWIGSAMFTGNGDTPIAAAHEIMAKVESMPVQVSRADIEQLRIARERVIIAGCSTLLPAVDSLLANTNKAAGA